MAVARMRKITILAYDELESALFEAIRDLELMHVTRSTAVNAGDGTGRNDYAAKTPEYVEKLSQLAVIKSYFEQYNTIEKGFIDMFTGKKPEMSFADFQQAVTGYGINRIFTTVKEHDQCLRDIAKEATELKQRVQSLAPWKELDIPIEEISPTRSCEMLLGIVPAAALSPAKESQSEISRKDIHYRVIWEERGQAGVWFVALSDEGPGLSTLISALGGVSVNLAREAATYSGTGYVSDVLQSMESRLKDLENEQEAILAEDVEMAGGLMEILALTDYYLDKKNLAEVQKESSRTRFTLVVEGYVKAKDVGRFREGLKAFRDIEIVDEEPKDDEDVPVYLENHPIIRPFEVVTNIFGYPQYNEVDPTPVLAPFFWIFFAMCLGDAVYGILLILLSWRFLKTQKLEDDKMIRLLMYCGVSTVIAGALMGSWLGDFPTAFLKGTVIERFTSAVAVIDPINDPLTLLLVSLAFGLVHIWAGIFVKMVEDIKAGRVADGIFDSGSWVVFLPGLVSWGLMKVGIIRSNIPLYIMAFGALMVMYSGSRGQKNILLKPISGVGGLYSIIGYFSDTLSYARILALGLASAIIGVVVNMVSSLVVSMLPKVGWVFVPVILAIGHVFNLVINALGSFIHSGRLQFVEFFTKFFEGGGRPFKPLRRVRENVSLTD
jgi:V/A-type H+-transporting ATPase subunit I